jgi:hypothetical protein
MAQFQSKDFAFIALTLRLKRHDSVNPHYRQNRPSFQSLESHPALRQLAVAFLPQEVRHSAGF